jgi:IS30 family transposase
MPPLTLDQVHPHKGYSTSQVAGLIGRCRDTVREMVQRGELATWPTPGKKLTIPGSEIIRICGENAYAAAVASKVMTHTEKRQRVAAAIKRIQRA